MLKQYIRYFTDKVVEALNIGSVEMVNLHQNLLTPDFILIGMLEQEASMTIKLIETSYPENKDLSNQILEKLFATQENQTKFEGSTIQQIQSSAETEACFEIALQESKKLGDKFIGLDAMFLALFDKRVGHVSDILTEFGL